MSERVFLHLRVRVSKENLEAFLRFLREAIPFYESPGGIRVSLVQDDMDPTSFIEIIEYDTYEVYKRDQCRANGDREMHDYLVRWRSLLMGRPEVVVYRERSVA